MRKIWDIHGGIHPPENKHQSTGSPIQPAGIPEQLILPLSQHIGAPAEVAVSVGQQVLKGEQIARAKGPVSAAIHAPTSGEIVAIEERPIPHPSGMSAPCIVLRPDGRDQWCERRPVSDWQRMERSDLLQHIRDAGIAGMGGAGFPSAIKLSSRDDKPIETLILNGTECEPYITADDMLMRERAAEIIAGAKILQHLVQPRRETLLGIEDNKPEAIAALRTAAEGSGIEVVVFPTKYPSGGEKQLIQILTGKEVPSGGLPADVGIVCQNVGTAAAIYRAIELGEPLISRITTITGEACRDNQNFEVLLGTPIRFLLERCRFDAGLCSRLVIGGPMMGYAVESLDVPVVKTTNCVLAPSRTELPPPDPAQACIRCGLCAEACPVSLLPQQMYWFARGQEWEKLEEHNLFDCIECGACSYSCPSNIPLVQYYRAGKAEIRRLAQDKAKAERAKARFEARKERLDREEAEKEARRKQRQQAAKTATESSAEADPIQAAIERAKAKKSAAAADPAQAAIARAQAKRAGAAEQSPREKAQQAVANLEKRLGAARNKLEQAREQGSDKLEAFEASVSNLEEKLVKAKEELSQLGDTTPPATDPAQAAIERAQAQRARQSDQSPEEKAAAAVTSLEKRLQSAQAKLAQAREQGSNKLEAFEASVTTLQGKLDKARADLSAQQTGNSAVPAPAASEPEDPAQAAIARAQAKRAAAAQLSPVEKAQQQVDSLQQRLTKSRDKLAAAEAEGSEHTELLANTVAKLEQQLQQARQTLAELEAQDA